MKMLMMTLRATTALCKGKKYRFNFIIPIYATTYNLKGQIGQGEYIRKTQFKTVHMYVFDLVRVNLRPGLFVC